MTDLSSMSNEELMRIAGVGPSQSAPTASSQPVQTDVSKMSNEELLRIINQEENSGVQGKVMAAVQEGGKGILNAVGDVAESAKNLLKYSADIVYGKSFLNSPEAAQNVKEGLDIAGNVASKYYGKFKDLRNSNPAYVSAAEANPVTGKIANVGGYILGNTLATLPVAGKAGQLAEKVGTAVSPTLMSGLAGKLGLQAAGQGFVQSAAANPDNMLKSGVIGAGTGLALGSAAGYIGSKMSRAKDIIDFEADNITASGGNPNSLEGISRIQKSLKDNGVDYSKIQVQKGITNAITDKILAAGPLDTIEQAPSVKLANIASTNFQTVAEKVKAGFEPLRKATEKFSPESTKAALAETGKASSLISKPLPENATINDMWTYRENIDDVIQSLRTRIIRGTGKVSDKENLRLLQNLRQGVTDDMLASADQIGLKDQFLATQKLYQDEYLPFKSFNTPSGKFLSKEDVNGAIKTLNTLFKSRNPDFNRLNNVAKSLGPDGNKLLGQGMLEKMVSESVTDKGLINPKTFYTFLKKANSSGLTSEVWGPETRQAAQGILKIVDGADEAMKLGSPYQPSYIKKFIDYFLTSRGGISGLKLLGKLSKSEMAGVLLKDPVIAGTGILGSKGSTEPDK